VAGFSFSSVITEEVLRNQTFFRVSGLRSTDADPERFIEPTTACGCIVGIYVTYTAEIVVILDSRDTACASDDHLPGRQIAIDQPRHDRAS
jgi:hypothetical protein